MLWALAGDVARMTMMDLNEPFAPEVVRRRAQWDALGTFDNTSQQDAGEAFNALLRKCDEVDFQTFREFDFAVGVREDSASAFTTPHWQIFGSLVKSSTTCANCPQVTDRYEMMSSFSLAIPEQGEPKIETLFADALGHEALDDVDDVCPNCTFMRQRSKTTVLERCPQVLVLHLKRWKFNARRGGFEKLHTRVSFETLLPLHMHAYDLRSVIVHHGEAGGGHYTAFVRAADNHWYHCDDALPPRLCRHVSEVLRCQAYMLMYVRR